MSDGAKLVRLIQKMAEPFDSETTDIMTGTVTSIQPLKIRIENLILTEEFLILSEFVQEKFIEYEGYHSHTVPSSTTGTSSSHSHSVPSNTTSVEPIHIKLWDGLQVNDRVYIIRFSKGQKYFVLQKIYDFTPI